MNVKRQKKTIVVEEEEDISHIKISESEWPKDLFQGPRPALRLVSLKQQPKHITLNSLYDIHSIGRSRGNRFYSSLETLSISFCTQLRSVQWKLMESLTELEISNCPDLDICNLPPSLEKLRLRPSFRIPPSLPSTNLRKLFLHDFYRLDAPSIPEFIHPLSRLEKLYLRVHKNRPNFVLDLQFLPSLRFLKFTTCATNRDVILPPPRGCKLETMYFHCYRQINLPGLILFRCRQLKQFNFIGMCEKDAVLKRNPGRAQLSLLQIAARRVVLLCK